MAKPLSILPPGPVVIIGTDVPGVTPRHIDRAFAALGSHDVVFGPSPDGGYWLVGVKRRPRVPDLFAGVRWSSEHALADTLRNCKGLKVGFVEALEDVDDGRSYARWAALKRGAL